MRAFASSGGISKWGVLEFTIVASEPTAPSATPNLDSLLTVAVPVKSITDRHKVDTSSPQSFPVFERAQGSKDATDNPVVDTIEIENEADQISIETMDLVFTDSALTDFILINS